MPNHVTSIVRFEGDPQKVQEVLEKIKNDELGIGTIDFNKIIPMPESLNIESGNRTSRGLKAYRDFIEVYTLGKNAEDAAAALKQIPRESEDAFLRMRRDIDRESLELGRAAYQNIQNYGAATWYEWSLGRWGTKWNAYGYDDPNKDYSANSELRFLTAWSAPHPILRKLSEMFPDLEITHEWADEDIGNNCGRIVYCAGERVEEYIPDANVEAIPFAAHVMDADPSDWGLYLTAAEDGYVYGFEKGYYLGEILGKAALFSKEKLTASDIPNGLHCYHLRMSKDGNNFVALTQASTEPYGGSIILKDELDFGSTSEIILTDVKPLIS